MEVECKGVGLEGILLLGGDVCDREVGIAVDDVFHGHFVVLILIGWVSPTSTFPSLDGSGVVSMLLGWVAMVVVCRVLLLVAGSPCPKLET